MERKKTGRPPKPGGPRKRVSYDLREALLDRLKVVAGQRGMYEVDLVEELLSTTLNVPCPQEGLRLDQAS